jgi:hypothetical protein
MILSSASDEWQEALEKGVSEAKSSIRAKFKSGKNLVGIDEIKPGDINPYVEELNQAIREKLSRKDFNLEGDFGNKASRN